MTKIEWCRNPDGTPGETWNPITGCTKVAQGCKNCYAKALHDMRHAAYKRGASLPKQYAVPFEQVTLHPERLEMPLHWAKPRRIFVNSMSDLFHFDAVNHPDWSDFITRLWLTMMRTPQHTYMILTKRPALMEYEVKLLVAAGMPVLPNVWLGTSVSTQPDADKNIPYLLQTPAAVRFVSCEPLLGPVDISPWLMCDFVPGPLIEPMKGTIGGKAMPTARIRPRVDWVIAGGESGPGARPMHPDWARSLRDQCQAADVPFFFKQWGEFHDDPLNSKEKGRVYMDATGKVYSDRGSDVDYRHGRLAFDRVGKGKAGRLLDGQEWNQFPEAR